MKNIVTFVAVVVGYYVMTFAYGLLGWEREIQGASDYIGGAGVALLVHWACFKDGRPWWE